MAEDQDTVGSQWSLHWDHLAINSKTRYSTNTEGARKNNTYMERVIWKAEFKIPFVNQKGQGSYQF